MSQDDRIRALAARIAADISALQESSGAGSASVPLKVLTGQQFTAPDNAQSLYRRPITVDGALVVDGLLLEV